MKWVVLLCERLKPTPFRDSPLNFQQLVSLELNTFQGRSNLEYFSMFTLPSFVDMSDKSQ